MDSNTVDYDVALSFAGENRNYVEQVASILNDAGVRVFYDRYETVALWGKDLYVHLSEIYNKRAKYTVMFISEHYAKKLWTNRERESAQARAFAEKREYILPARFDKTEVPGMLPTVGYVNLKETSPGKLAEMIVLKLKDSEKRQLTEETKVKENSSSTSVSRTGEISNLLKIAREITSEATKRRAALGKNSWDALIVTFECLQSLLKKHEQAIKHIVAPIIYDRDLALTCDRYRELLIGIEVFSSAYEEVQGILSRSTEFKHLQEGPERNRIHLVRHRLGEFQWAAFILHWHSGGLADLLFKAHRLCVLSASPDAERPTKELEDLKTKVKELFINLGSCDLSCMRPPCYPWLRLNTLTGRGVRWNSRCLSRLRW